MVPLSTASDAELVSLLAGIDAAPYRAAQLRRAAWDPTVDDLATVTTLPSALRAELAPRLRFCTTEIVEEVVADSGLTLKLLVRLADGRHVETVAMETPAQPGSRRRGTVCVSSQVGCAVGCPFCATGRAGLTRSCSAAEIVDQVRCAARALHRRGLGPVTHVVFMGMGEPLANTDAVLEAVRTLVDGAGLSARRITVSTSGVVPQIHRLAEEAPPVTLAVSLHAADDRLRDRLVPLNRTHPLDRVVGAATAYAERTGRRVTFEWCLIGGVNDSVDQASALRRLARRARAHVNVIPMNRIEGSPWGPPPEPVARAFLEALGEVATVRRTRGVLADAACGQLRAGMETRRLLRLDGSLGPPRRLAAP